MKEMAQETLEVQKWKAEKHRQKLELARSKYEKQLKDMEDKG